MIFVDPDLFLPDALIGSSAQPPTFFGLETKFKSRSSSNESTKALIEVPLLGLSEFGSRGETDLLVLSPVDAAAAAAARRPFLADYNKYIKKIQIINNIFAYPFKCEQFFGPLHFHLNY